MKKGMYSQFVKVNCSVVMMLMTVLNYTVCWSFLPNIEIMFIREIKENKKY